MIWKDPEDAPPRIGPADSPQLPLTPAPDYSIDYAAGLRVVPCKRCGAPMVFVRGAKSPNLVPIDRMPLDPRPTEHRRGLVVFEGPDRLRHLTKDRPPQCGQPIYSSHFSTCPFAGEFRS